MSNVTLRAITGVKEFMTMAAYGDEDYSKEELIAEMGAAMLCTVTGIQNDAITENSAAYINSWLKVLRNDVKLVVSAAGKAQRAVDYIRGVKWEEQDD